LYFSLDFWSGNNGRLMLTLWWFAVWAVISSETDKKQETS
jgi:hypothetical protein